MAQATGAREAEGKTVMEIFEMIGWGRYQTILFVVCGLGWVADAVETGLLSFLKQELQGSVDEFALASLQYMVFVGEFLGCFLWGPLADRVGRLWAFLFANAGLTIFGLASAFAPHFAWLVVLRFLVGCCIGGIVIPFDTLLEFTEERYKETVLYAINYWWTVGTLFINVAASITLRLELHSFEPWRLLCIVAAVPVLLAALGFFVMEESPLWLHAVGRNEEALAVLGRIARKNGRSLEGVELRPNNHLQGHPSMLEVVRQPYRVRTAVYAAIWLLGLLGYYGASLADPFIFEEAAGEVNYGLVVFSACGEFVGIFLFQIISKRQVYLWTTSMSFAASAIFVFLIFLKFALVPASLLGVIVFFARAGVMANTVGFYRDTQLLPHTHPLHCAFVREPVR